MLRIQQVRLLKQSQNFEPTAVRLLPSSLPRLKHEGPKLFLAQLLRYTSAAFSRSSWSATTCSVHARITSHTHTLTHQTDLHHRIEFTDALTRHWRSIAIVAVNLILHNSECRTSRLFQHTCMATRPQHQSMFYTC